MEQHLIDIFKLLGLFSKSLDIILTLNMLALIGIIFVSYKLAQIGIRIDELTGRRKKKEESDKVKAFGVEKS